MKLFPGIDSEGEIAVDTSPFLLPKHSCRGQLWHYGSFLGEAWPSHVPSSFKRLTAEEREGLEQMKTSRFDNKETSSTNGTPSAGDNGNAVGFLSSVPGVSSLAGSSYVLSAVEYAKENPLTALWTVGPAACSVLMTAARSTYNYFYPPEQSWLGGWDGGLLAGTAVGGVSWFGTSTAASSSWWPGSQPQASSSWFGFGSQPEPASSSWFGGTAAPAEASSSWFGTSTAAGATAGGATAGWFGGLFGGGDQKANASTAEAPAGEAAEGGLDLEGDFDLDLGGDDEEGCEQQ